MKVPDLLLLLAVTSALYLPETAAAAATVCQLQLVGQKPRSGLRSAHLACEGSIITAAANPTWLSNKFTVKFAGVTWTGSGDCGKWQDDCLVTICGDSQAQFINATVVNISTPGIERVLCIGGRSKLLFQGALLADNAARPLTGVGRDAQLTLNTSKLLNNSLSGVASKGGAVLMEAGRLLIESSVFAGNQASVGGALAAGGTASITVRSTSFIGNTGVKEDGAILMDESAALHATSSVWQQNKAPVAGSLRLSGRSKAVIVRCNCTHNSAESGHGGCMALDGSAALDLRESQVTFNQARDTGGGLDGTDGATLNITRCTLSNNKAASGGAVAADGSSNLELMDTDISGNTVDQGGGGLLVMESSVLYMEGCRVMGNNATDTSGLGATGNATVEVVRTVFSNNTAVRSCGAIFAGDNASVSLKATTVVGNSAERAGAIGTRGNAALQLLEGTIISNNTATNIGGGLKVASKNFVWQQIRSSVSGNTAPTAPDVAADPVNLTLVNGESNISSFVSRLGSNEGYLNVPVNVTGPQGLPAQAELLATLNGSKLVTEKSGDDGIANMTLKLRQKPGTPLTILGEQH